jgi:hypothetical protein
LEYYTATGTALHPLWKITRSGVLKEADCSGLVFLYEKGYVLSRRNDGEMDINCLELKRLGAVLGGG